MIDTEWMGLAASAAGGGVFGLLGTVFGRVYGFFEKKQEHQFREDERRHEIALLAAQREASRAQIDGEIDVADTAGKWAGLEASMKADAAIGESYRWVNAVRALTSPTLTLALWLIIVIVFTMSSSDVRPRLVEAVIFAATSATLWWFGDRTQRGRAVL